MSSSITYFSGIGTVRNLPAFLEKPGRAEVLWNFRNPEDDTVCNKNSAPV